MMKLALLVAGCLVLVATALAPGPGAARSAIPYKWKNCTIVNMRYPHGVGKRFAHDRTKSGDPVTNFKRSTLLYLTAMRYNRGLDRDKDGIACENH
jgi:Excalibur calcium-binding domain